LSNELRILPLRKYTVTYIVSIDTNDKMHEDTFTADYHNVTEGRNQFFRTGNVIREYQYPLLRIVVTPVDDAEVPE
jgi:hypothetical protein